MDLNSYGGESGVLGWFGIIINGCVSDNVNDGAFLIDGCREVRDGTSRVGDTTIKQVWTRRRSKCEAQWEAEQC